MSSEVRISKGLDYYKATMGQLEYTKHPDAEVTFELKNRSPRKLSEFVDPTELQDRLNTLRQGWHPDEIAYLASLQNQDGQAQFTPQYLDFLADNQLPPVQVGYDDRGDIAVSSTGKWPLVSLVETIAMSETNEMYYKNKLKSVNQNISDLYRVGDERFDYKRDILRAKPYIKVSDFGTRRRFSYRWHKHIVERLAEELPDNFMGTSNPYLAHKFNQKPIGTFAHELPMVYSALADLNGDNPLSGHRQTLLDWQDLYRGDLSIALTDTFTSDFFFRDFTAEQAQSWKGLRHDSGDPIKFGERAIDFYKQQGIDPGEKMIVFSDGLDIDKIVLLADHFKDRIGTTFGWGTTLTNDLGVEPNNFVMKATAVNGMPAVKLSDAIGKHTGPPEKIDLYQRKVAQALAKTTLRRQLVTN